MGFFARNRLDYNIDNGSDVRVLLIEHDAEIPLNTFLNEYSNLECIFFGNKSIGKSRTQLFIQEG